MYSLLSLNEIILIHISVDLCTLVCSLIEISFKTTMKTFARITYVIHGREQPQKTNQ